VLARVELHPINETNKAIKSMNTVFFIRLPRFSI